MPLTYFIESIIIGQLVITAELRLNSIAIRKIFWRYSINWSREDENECG